MYDANGSRFLRFIRRSFVAATLVSVLGGCGGGGSPSRGMSGTDGADGENSGQWKSDVLNLPSGGGGAPLKSGADVSKSLNATATALESAPTDNAEQKTAMAEAVVVVRSMGQRYTQLKPNMSLALLSQWLKAQAEERRRLKAAADKLRRAGQAALADAMNELSARLDVMMFRRAVPYGGVRHAYLASAGQGNVNYLEGYAFGGIAFQIFDKSLTSRGQVIDQPLKLCQMEAAEGKPKIPGVTDSFWIRQKKVSMWFLAPNCEGQTEISTLGYIANSAGVVTGRPLHWLRRWEHPEGDEFAAFMESLKPWNLVHPSDSDMNFYDSITVPNLAAAQAIVYSDRNFHSVNDLSESTAEAFTPIGYVP